MGQGRRVQSPLGVKLRLQERVSPFTKGAGQSEKGRGRTSFSVLCIYNHLYVCMSQCMYVGMCVCILDVRE